MKYWAFLIIAYFFTIGHSYSGNLVVEPSTTYLDALIPPYNQVTGGDTIFLKSGDWTDLKIINFQGKPDAPIVFINKGGVVIFATDYNFAISISNCRYFRLTGTGDPAEFYGIQVDHVDNGTGLGIGELSSDYEIDHILIRNVPIAGIYAKTDPNCLEMTTRDMFTQYNTIIHDNYIENAGNEGMYIGSTRYSGHPVLCNDKDTLLFPSLLEGVRVYNNIIRNSGWDGIQVSSASKDCRVYGNQIWNDSQGEMSGQMSGIILGGGSSCDCFNNLIVDGKGVGIENHGLGGNRIFNNIIVNAGRTYLPDDNSASKMKHGIFVSDNSTIADSSMIIQNNTIINPKSDGIRFASINSKSNLISSNVIINPGNYPVYEYGNTQFKGMDAYVMIPNKLIDVVVTNNYYSLDITNAMLFDDFSLSVNSPLINAGYADQPYIAFDFSNKQRQINDIPDIGAFEYLRPVGNSKAYDKQNSPVVKFLNPVENTLILEVNLNTASNITVGIFDKSGRKLLNKELKNRPAGWNKIQTDVEGLVPGFYLFTLMTSQHAYSNKFIKTSNR